MNNRPAKRLVLAPVPPASRGWLGFGLSVLCVLHCVAGAVLVPLLPTALALLSESAMLEWSLLAMSALMAALLAFRQGRRPGAPSLLIWTTATASGVAGLTIESEALHQAALLALALLQLRILLQRRRRLRRRAVACGVALVWCATPMLGAFHAHAEAHRYCFEHRAIEEAAEPQSVFAEGQAWPVVGGAEEGGEAHELCAFVRFHRQRQLPGQLIQSMADRVEPVAIPDPSRVQFVRPVAVILIAPKTSPPA
jgi:hypothetical protein